MGHGPVYCLVVGSDVGRRIFAPPHRIYHRPLDDDGKIDLPCSRPTSQTRLKRSLPSQLYSHQWQTVINLTPWIPAVEALLPLVTLDLVTRLPPPTPTRAQVVGSDGDRTCSYPNLHFDSVSSTIRTSAGVLHSPPVIALLEFLMNYQRVSKPQSIDIQLLPMSSIANSRATLGHYDPSNPAEYSTACTESSKPSSASSKYTLHSNCNTWYHHTSTLHHTALSCSTVFLVLATLATHNYLTLTANQYRRLTRQFVNTGIRAVLSSHDAMHCYIPL